MAAGTLVAVVHRLQQDSQACMGCRKVHDAAPAEAGLPQQKQRVPAYTSAGMHTESLSSCSKGQCARARAQPAAAKGRCCV